MKRFFAVFMLLALAVSISACGKSKTDENNSSQEAEITTITTEIQTDIDITELTTKNVSGDDIGGGNLGLLKYRLDYYNVPAPFTKIVDRQEYEIWHDEIAKENPSETNEMVMKKFVQDFNVSREDFDRANLEWAKIIISGFKGEPMMNPQDFANQETDEVYNADIIYTFDDEIINSYYLSHDYPFWYADEYEEAVANGTYETRTKDWIDVEQMEAEINAKYGEKETTTTVETTAA